MVKNKIKKKMKINHKNGLQVVEIYNMRIIIRQFAESVHQLSKFGPMRPDEEKGLSSKILRETVSTPVTMDAEKDPNALRIGLAPPENLQETLIKAVNAAFDYIGINRTQMREETTFKQLLEHFNILKGSVMMAYPMGLPDVEFSKKSSNPTLTKIYDPIKAYVEIKENNFENLLVDVYLICENNKCFDLKTAQLWFSSRKLFREDILAKYIGSNEKSKLVVKITKEKGHIPIREPMIDEETRKKMLAFWHKKQEEDKYDIVLKFVFCYLFTFQSRKKFFQQKLTFTLLKLKIYCSSKRTSGQKTINVFLHYFKRYNLFHWLSSKSQIHTLSFFHRFVYLCTISHKQMVIVKIELIYHTN
ncbi:hypothetical protein RFI_31629 [Reticulomyxa filosa]|uniref:Uncharacterized protein n=1 Tax=Reticulomyxa filosa TaxID=46433 RepID=X6LV13_RETFI|nr:hypothetical protein RFI_31629 [Reticulomyxa filosa]|eukprot:ETO05768.1 hypothetical protein RFI_31629 [Reticulomyxa filosa]